MEQLRTIASKDYRRGIQPGLAVKAMIVNGLCYGT
jgi:hypothetical protein